MNKTARHVLRQCFAIRQFKSSLEARDAILSRPYLHHASFCHTFGKNDSVGPLTVTSTDGENDIVMQRILESVNSDQVFEVVDQCRSAWKINHSIQALKTLQRLKCPAEPSILEKNGFLQICKTFSKDAKSLDPNDVVRILRAFKEFHVPTASVISQTLLQIVRRSINQISFGNLLYLDQQLKSWTRTPLTNALRVALPIACELQLSNKMIDTSNVKELKSAMLFLSKRDRPTNGADVVIDGLLNTSKDIAVADAIKILSYLCDSDVRCLPIRYKDLLYNMQTIVADQMMQIPFSQIEMTLRKITKQVKMGNRWFYHEGLLDAFAKMIISQDIEFNKGISVLKYLYNLGHTQIRLIDYLAAKCFEDPKVLANCDRSTLVTLVIGLAVADYKPIFWEFIQEFVSNDVKKDHFAYDSQIMNFVVSLAVFDCYYPELLKQVFTDEFLERELMYESPMANWNILLLYQSVKLLYSEYDGPWPSERILKSCIAYNRPSDNVSALLPALEKSMGGARYVLSNLRTKLGHYVDHAIVIRKGGYPIAINQLTESSGNNDNSVLYVEDLKLPVESQVILVMNIPADAYAVNSRRMKGSWTLLLRTLEIQTTHTVIPINTAMWTDLSDYEKIPYLMQAVRLKCDDLRASANL